MSKKYADTHTHTHTQEDYCNPPPTLGLVSVICASVHKNQSSLGQTTMVVVLETVKFPKNKLLYVCRALG